VPTREDDVHCLCRPHGRQTSSLIEVIGTSEIAENAYDASSDRKFMSDPRHKSVEETNLDW